MHIIFFVLEIIGTVAFSVSGAMTALKKKMDLFGVVILGLTTAVGGGIIRDITLGITPPISLRNPVYAIVAMLTALAVFLPCSVRFLCRSHQLFDNILGLMDSLGLGVFTVAGIKTAYSMHREYSLFFLVFVGVMTGVGGGIVRDVLSGEAPFVFKRHFYATASVIGALVCVFLWELTNDKIAIIGGASTVILLRILASHFRWKLPKYDNISFLS